MNPIKRLHPAAVLAASTALAALAASPAALAQGNVDGYILGEITAGGGPVSGATVTARNTGTGLERSETTGAGGGYRLSRLPTGAYEVTVTAPGFRGATREVAVNIGQGSPASFTLVPGNVEQIVVTGQNVAPVDVTLAETTTVFTATEIERLPVPRDLNAVALMAPGALLGDGAFASVSGLTGTGYNNTFGFASLGGASVAENAYYINGMNVTNFRNGLGGSTVPFEFYDQFQLKTGGLSAEFGRSTGGVINAVTRRGTNEWRIRSGFVSTPEALRGHSPDVGDPSNPGEYTVVLSVDERDETEAFLSVGGPIIEDQLFFYGIYQYRDIQFENYTGGGQLLSDSADDPFWGGKIDWLISDNHTLELTAFSDEYQTVRTTYEWGETTGLLGEDLGITLIDRGGENYIGKYTGDFGDLTVAVMAGKSSYDLTEKAPTDDTCPGAYDSRGGGLRPLGCWVNFSPSSGNDSREVYRIDVEYELGDRHLLRIGVDNETNTSVSQTKYSGPQSGGPYYRYYDTEPGATLGNGAVVPDGITELVRFRQYTAGGTFETLAESYYIEDEWRVTDTVTARIGLRNERFNNKNSLGGTFIKVTDQWAPRLGVSWDIRGDGASKLFANFGRYHLPVASNTNIRLAGAELFTQEWYTLGGAIQADGSVALGDKLGDTTVYGDGSIPDVETTIDLGIQPMYQDEFILGYETELVGGFFGGITYAHRTLGQGIEDITIDEALDAPGEFHYILANPGRPVHTFYDVDGDGVNEEYRFSAEELNYPPMEREYRAVNLFVQKNWANGLYLRANYTWSRSFGNNEGLVRSDNGQDDAGLTTLYDFSGLVEGAYGYLPNDRRHNLKVFTSYELLPGLQMSLSANWHTGRPTNAFGVHPTDSFSAQYGAASFYRQGVFTPRGSLGRSPNVTAIDLGLRYETDFGPNTLTFRADVFNVLNADTVIEINEVADQSSGIAAPSFLLPGRFQRPRAVRLSATYDFGL